MEITEKKIMKPVYWSGEQEIQNVLCFKECIFIFKSTRHVKNRKPNCL